MLSASPFICLWSERDKSVLFWSQGSYSLYNAKKADKFREKIYPPGVYVPLKALFLVGILVGAEE